VVARTAGCGYEEELASWLSHMVASVSAMAQSEEQHALLVYFHTPDDDRALPLALEDLLELLTICRALLDPRSFPRLATGHITLTAYRVNAVFAADRADNLGAASAPDRPEPLTRFEGIYGRLDAAGVPLRDREDACSDYLQLLGEWDDAVSSIEAHFGYPTRRPA
jgi:hypothetical protein